MNITVVNPPAKCPDCGGEGVIVEWLPEYGCDCEALCQTCQGSGRELTDEQRMGMMAYHGMRLWTG